MASKQPIRLCLVDKTNRSGSAEVASNCKGICPPKAPRLDTIERPSRKPCLAANAPS